MTDRQRNYLNMTEVCMSVMDTNNAIWTGNTPITNNVAAIKAQIANIYDVVGYNV